MQQDRKKELKFEKSREFRYHAVDAMSATLSDNSLKMLLGVEEESERVVVTVGLHMTHKTVGIMYAALRATIERYERDTGNKFPIPSDFSALNE